MHEEEDSSEEDNDDELTLLTKNFKKFLKKVGKSSKSSSSFPNTFKGKNSSKNPDFTNNDKKKIQCRECEGFEHIQSKCVNTQKKKSKALKSTLNDDEFDDSQEDDNLVTNQVAFSGTLIFGNCVLVPWCLESVATNTVCLSIKSYTVATNSKTASSSLWYSDSDYGDESEKDNESLQEAYEKMYIQWLKVCATNRAMNDEIQELFDLKAKAEVKVVQLEALFAEKDENLKSVATKLERTQKTLRLLNNGTSKLDHLIITGKSFGDHSNVGYKGESSGSKTIYVKSALLTDSFNISYNKPVVKSIAIESNFVVLVWCNR